MVIDQPSLFGPSAPTRQTRRAAVPNVRWPTTSIDGFPGDRRGPPPRRRVLTPPEHRDTTEPSPITDNNESEGIPY